MVLNYVKFRKKLENFTEMFYHLFIVSLISKVNSNVANQIELEAATCTSSQNDSKLNVSVEHSAIRIVYGCNDTWEVSGSKIDVINNTVVHHGSQNGKNTAYSKAIRQLSLGNTDCAIPTRIPNCDSDNAVFTNFTINDTAMLQKYKVSQISWTIKVNQIMDRFGDEIGIIHKHIFFNKAAILSIQLNIIIIKKKVDTK